MITERTTSVSVEPFHFYREDFQGEKHLTDLFWLGEPFARAAMADRVATTCLMLDDYHNALPPDEYEPAEVYGQLQRAAEKAGVPLDYIGREGACADLASDILRQLCEHPSSAPYIKSHHDGSVWLLDTPPDMLIQNAQPVMKDRTPQRQPRQPVDASINLYGVDRIRPNDPFACCLLAAIWQGVRLGAIRSPGFDSPPLIENGNFPNWKWGEIPPLVQLNPNAAPFVADRTYSVLCGDNMVVVENAANRIINHLGVVLGAEQFVTSRIDRTTVEGLPQKS